VEITGSGMSAAHAAGAIALLLQTDPELTPAEVKDLLIETATDLGFEANAQGAGLANIEEALARVRDRDGDGIPDAEDTCPDEPGLPEHDGCLDPTPTITPSATPTAMPTPTPTASTTPVPLGGNVMVPASTFSMGSDEEAIEAALRLCPTCKREDFLDETPQHTVFISEFSIDRTEVANRDYKRFIDAHPNWPVPYLGVDWAIPYNWDQTERIYPPDKADHPVVLVSWEDANAYCLWAGGRLPTEAEWEKAASWDPNRNEKRIWPWGNAWNPNLLNSSYSSPRGIMPVGSFPAGASPYNVLDMAGNVWEWVADWYDPSYYGRAENRDPKGPGRDKASPDVRDANVGFRCVR